MIEVRTTSVNGYLVVGNAHVAIAVNIEDDTDSHYFTPSVVTETFTLGAFDAAIAWTSPGI